MTDKIKINATVVRAEQVQASVTPRDLYDAITDVFYRRYPQFVDRYIGQDKNWHSLFQEPATHTPATEEELKLNEHLKFMSSLLNNISLPTGSD